MEMEVNQTIVTEFVLVGFTTNPVLRLVVFVVFLVSYTLTLTGNMSLIALIYLDSHLHTPMYFFVGNLSFLDVWFTSVYTPRVLSDCVSKNRVMSIAGCAAQYFFSCALVYTECCLLATMAYDRYVAICNPLLYATAMPKKLCIQLVIASYVTGLISAIIHTGNTFRLRFCGDNTIDHFYCDAPPLMRMACDDLQVFEIIMVSAIACNVFATTVVIVSSYIGIGAAIIRIRSAAGRRKAFSTCSAHLISVFFYYGAILLMYSRPSAQHSPTTDKANAMFYTIVNPLANPIIYSFRNKDVKVAFKKVLGRFFPPK